MKKDFYLPPEMRVEKLLLSRRFLNASSTGTTGSGTLDDYDYEDLGNEIVL